MEYIAIALLRKPFGVRGELKATSLTDFPRSRFKKTNRFYLQNPKTREVKEVHLSSCKGAGEDLILGFVEIASVEEAEEYRGYEVLLDKAQAPLPKNTYRFADLIGCEAVNESGELLGKVTDVLDYATTKTLRIARDGDNDFFVPFIDAFVPTVDIEKKQIVIHVVEGML